MLRKQIMMDFYCDLCGHYKQIIADEEVDQPEGWLWVYHNSAEMLVCLSCTYTVKNLLRDLKIDHMLHPDEAHILIGNGDVTQGQ